ncbi:hypothetical protein J6590_045308 [Homalodisca vitripennis]|nr:hypothetical protein J6590_045308 [Homalodisca vitripennis]
MPHVQPSNDPSLFRTNDIRQLSRHDNTISTSRSETTTNLQLDDSEYHMYNLATTRHYSAPMTSANCRGTITLSLLHGSETTTNLQLDDSEYHIYNLATTRRYSVLTTSANCNGTITLSPLHRVKQRQTYS